MVYFVSFLELKSDNVTKFYGLTKSRRDQIKILNISLYPMVTSSRSYKKNITINRNQSNIFFETFAPKISVYVLQSHHHDLFKKKCNHKSHKSIRVTYSLKRLAPKFPFIYCSHIITISLKKM